MSLTRQFVFALFSLGFVATGLGQVVDSKPEGNPAAPKYKNSGLGFELTLPMDWYVADAQELEEWANEARKELRTGYKLSKSAVLHQMRVENIAFGISKKKLGAQRNSMFGFSIMKQASDEVTSTMVAHATKQFVLKDSSNALAKDVSTRPIGGRDFAEFDFIVTSALGKQKLRVMVVNYKGYSITFALTYWNDLDDLRLMMSAVESTRFLPQ